MMENRKGRAGSWPEKIRQVIIAAAMATLGTLSGIDGVHAVELASARIPGSYRTWTIQTADGTESSVSQVFAPVVSTVALGAQADWVFSTGAARSKIESATSETESLTGTSDLKSQLFYRLIGDRLLLQAGANLPLGSKGLTAEELVVTQSLSHPLLGFRMKHYGEGLNLSGGAALAFPLGEQLTFALGGGFVQRGEYEFVTSQPDFKPGTETSFSAGLDYLSENGQPLARIDTSYRTFGADESGGEEVFQEGNQIEGQLHLFLRPGNLSSSLLLRGIHKEDNEALTSNGETVDAIALKAGRSIFIRYTLGMAIRESSYFGVLADWTTFTSSEILQNEGSVWGLGPTFQQQLGDHGQIGVTAMFLQGKTDGETAADELDLSGADLSFRLTLRP